MTTNNKISNLVSSQVPFFVRNDHQNFVNFLQSYYEYLEQTGKAVDVSKNIRSYQDIDQAPDEFAEKLYLEYMKLMPTDIRVDKPLLMKHIRDFYAHRGTEKSIRFLLNLLFGREDVEFYYPKKDILKASDGKWHIQKTLRIENLEAANVSNNTLAALEKFVNKAIYGANSGATATGERVDKVYLDGTIVNEISISSIVGTFENGEQIYAYYDGVPYISGANTITPVHQVSGNVFGGILNTINILTPGTGYNVGDPAIIESIVGSQGVAVVSKVSTGNISSITALTGGAGYHANDYVLITGGGGTGANAEVILTLTTGVVHPNTYTIYYDTISLEANTNTTNGIANGIYESFAYQNLNIIYTTTSNLRANTYTSSSSLNLTSWKSNSNVYFETFDSLNVTNQVSGVSNTVLITSSNSITNIIYISPAFATPQKTLTIQVIKRANSDTSLADALHSYAFSNVGPIIQIRVNDPGTAYTSVPSTSVLANTALKSLGILGRMEINNGGNGYVVGDVITFTNVLGGYGTGGAANVKTVNATGSITNVQFMFVSGHPVGGAGYDQNYLPVANVVSGTGANANVQVTQVLGTGGSLIVANTVLGAIETITITNRGQGYTFIPTINLTQSGDGTAKANATVIEGVFTYPGRYLNDDGHLSSYNFLEDRDYYQPYSYVVRVGESISKYRKALKDLIHPAGMKLFGEYVQTDNNENYSTVLTSADSNNSTRESKTFIKTGNTINVYYTTHGLSVNNTISLEFLSGNYKNVKNGIYTVTKVNTSNYFEVKQPRGYAQSISIVNPGLNYNSNSYIVFTTDYGKSNGFFNVNAYGSIVSSNITDFGRYYNSVPKANANGTNSVAAVFSITLDQYANSDLGNVYVTLSI